LRDGAKTIVGWRCINGVAVPSRVLASSAGLHRVLVAGGLVWVGYAVAISLIHPLAEDLTEICRFSIL
jgi:hypothetical protein